MLRIYNKVVLNWKDGVLEIFPNSEKIYGYNIVILEDAHIEEDGVKDKRRTSE